jgi:hypothetical protein
MRLNIIDPQGEVICLDVSPQTTISSVKLILSCRVGVDPGRQTLHFRGSILSDSMSLLDCHIQSGTTIYLTVVSPADDSLIEEMIQAPAVQSLLRRSTCFFTEMELSEFLHDYFELFDSPHLLAESGKLADQCLTHLEASPAGLREISQTCQDFEDSGMEAALFGRPESEPMATVIGDDPDEPSCEPLPCLFQPGWVPPPPAKPRTRRELNDGRCGRVVQPQRREEDSSKR